MTNFFLGVLASLVAAAIWHFLVNRERDVRIGAKVFDINIPNSEDRFYISLNRAISNARNEVIQYGEGFATSPTDRLNAAKKYVDSMRKILQEKPNLTWTRIQTRNPCSENWFELVQSLCHEFPARFKLYLLNNRPNDHLFSIAALIDPNMRQNKTFLLISKPKNVGAENAVNVGDVALMIKGSERWSKSLDEKLNRMRDLSSKYVTLVTSETNFSDLPKARR